MTLSVASQIKTIIISRVNYGGFSTPLEFSVSLNQAPEKVVLVSPVDDDILISNPQPILIWNVPVDHENHDLHFQLQVDLVDTFDSQVGGVPLIVADSLLSYTGFDFTVPKPSGTGQASYELQVPLSNRTVYHWRVRAYDGARYGEWSDAFKMTVGILATSVLLEADVLYAPVANTVSHITATFVDKLGNVDEEIDDMLIFTQSQASMGSFSPHYVQVVDGIASTDYTTSGVLGATYIEVVTPLDHNVLMLRSIVMGEQPVLLTPANGRRLPTGNQPRLIWLVPDDTEGDPLHFKVEIFNSVLMNGASLIYEADSSINTLGFSPGLPIAPLSATAWHDVQNVLPDAKYWWKVTPYDGVYKPASEVFVFSMPDIMEIVSKSLVSEKRVSQVVAMANVTLRHGTENVKAVARHYVTNMALEPENEVAWEEVTDKVLKRSKHVFEQKEIPAHGWAIAIKTIIEAHETTGEIALNGHGVVFDGDYVGSADEDYIGVLSAITPIGFTALPVDNGNSIALTWTYVDLNTPSRRVTDKFIVEVFNTTTGEYEPYDGATGEILA